MSAEFMPNLLKSDLEIYNLNTKLMNLRSGLQIAYSQIESGSFSIKRSLSTLLDDIFSVIDTIKNSVEVFVIPQNEMTNFLNAINTLDEYASFEIVDYYNELNKLKLIYSGMKAAVKQISDVSMRPLETMPSDGGAEGILESLDDEEFLEVGFENPGTEIEQAFRYYTIIEGDTLPGISAKVYDGDATRWPEISQVNNISESNLIDDSLIGYSIKIPVDAGGIARSSSNLVYEPLFNGENQTDIDQYLYGTDIYLDSQRRINVDSSGDIRMIAGLPCVVANVEDHYVIAQGELNPLNPEFGIIKPDDPNIPYFVLLDRVLTNMESQAMLDPRVLSAYMDRNTIKIIGDKYEVDQVIELIGGQTDKTSIPVVT